MDRDQWDLIRDADQLLTRVTEIKKLVRAAAASDEEAMDWLVDNLDGLDALPGEVVETLSRRNRPSSVVLKHTRPTLARTRSDRPFRVAQAVWRAKTQVAAGYTEEGRE